MKRRHILPVDSYLSAPLMTLRSGLIHCAVVSLAATFLGNRHGAPVMLLALLLGISLNSIAPVGLFMPGVEFTSKTILRIGVALLGARITLAGVFELGLSPVFLAVAGVGTTIQVGLVLARLMGKSASYGVLTGGAVGICGASAALALAAVLPEGDRGISEQDTILTVIGVTSLSTLAMVAYPAMTAALGYSEIEAGIFVGATVHDVAQVVGAGYTISVEAGDAATVTKLLRVMLLVPVVAVLAIVLLAKTSKSAEKVKFPAFLLFFVVLVALNSAGWIPPWLSDLLTTLSSWALVAAVAGLGMRTSLHSLMNVGVLSLAIIVIETIWIAGLAAFVISF